VCQLRQRRGDFVIVSYLAIWRKPRSIDEHLEANAPDIAKDEMNVLQWLTKKPTGRQHDTPIL
jgi:hypothetical protein